MQNRFFIRNAAHTKALPPKTPLKFWNIASISEDEAEITLYGEIVSSRPIDWWTGEPEPGLFVNLDDFLADLKQIENAANITVRINSVGGDYFTGATIQSRLRELTGAKTVIIDGLAASAASIIAMAGDVIQMHRGSMMMIHEPMIGICGWFQLADLNRYTTELDAVSNALVDVYQSKTGKDAAEIRELLAAETWMTSEDAVKMGFADEIIQKEATVAVSNDHRHLISNGVSMPAASLRHIPKALPVENRTSPAAVPSVEDIKSEKEGKKMDPKTIQELIAAFPELAAQLQNAAKQEGILAERKRLQEIDEFAPAVADTDLVHSAKYGKNPMDAGQFAIAVFKKQAAMGATFADARAKELENSGVQAVGAAPNSGNPANAADIAKQEETDAAALLIAAIPNKKEAKTNG